MARNLEEMGELGSEDWLLVERGQLSRILGMEIPAIGVDSEASFERLRRALDDRRDANVAADCFSLASSVRRASSSG
jgi:hypothetical protein